MKKKLTAILSSLILLAGCGSSSAAEAASAAPSSTPVPSTDPQLDVNGNADGEYVLDDNTLQQLRQELSEDEGINKDVKAVLYFNSGLIHDPVLQGTDNNHYLYVNWQTDEYQSYGSILMDYENDIDAMDMNTIIYGHYIYEYKNPDRTLVFTPLAKMTDRSNYEANKYVTLVTDKNVRYYEVASVYNCPMVDVGGGQVTEEDLQFNLVTYSESYWNEYMSAVEQHQYYETDVELNYGDPLLTLQTCIEEHPESREIVLCKELARVEFTD